MDNLASQLQDLSLESTTELPGLEDVYQQLVEVVQYPIVHAGAFRHLNIEAPKGVLLYGPPGVGKTRLVSTIASATNAALTTVQGPEIIGPYLGESEERLRKKFVEAREKLLKGDVKASILFIDEIDSIAPKRQQGTQSNQASARLVAQLLTLMDGLESRGRIVVIGATNMPNVLDPALRRPGRFDREIHIDVPNQIQRRKILEFYTRKMTMSILDLDMLAEQTNGFVGADIAALCREAASSAINRRLLSKQPKAAVDYGDFKVAMKKVVPSTKRGLGIDVAQTQWTDVGGLEEVKLKLKQCVEWPLTRANTMKRLGIRMPRGILLFGPPGCSKTTLIKVIATQNKATFLSVSGASLYSPFVGDAERTLRELFRKARSARPSVIFFDEVEAMVGKRAMGGSGNADSVQERILSTLLNEMDGVEAADDVLVVGATNRIDMIDDALLRPGRFDRIIYVPPPDLQAREDILRIKTRSMPLDDSVDIADIARKTELFSGADIANLVREAAILALREGIDAQRVTMRCFEEALQAVQPSLKPDQMEMYRDMQSKYV
ncbi:hypothetical protein LPJ78_002289 [Coemansia sp. RSA 989]|nr:P-loop containing nucleoside triphosphate hydrolase protein [Coemansia mojavensis]KAJ1740096.1 hypothetical protein LPJ68_004080 [Coemansia sp. RSA 1086]KAJ1749084.1 hypothetical protein LPJ79_004012 [Coemansia sp. RSA 1821]KAJ1865889.1 hypothetical protein LPJ78_002289 [Coemansia sp. RSA 989]KAJ1873034.1 hypothetical protein LPJ55_002596 [Coemansia sp. RSA 990]KAJ2673373.1 hypothetical protein IWW42_002383 [Coemansia sp. RSA 1085]